MNRFIMLIKKEPILVEVNTIPTYKINSIFNASSKIFIYSIFPSFHYFKCFKTYFMPENASQDWAKLSDAKDSMHPTHNLLVIA